MLGGAFENCSGLTSVTFKEGIAEAVIGQDSFNGCQSLLSVIIPGNYSKIADSAFRNCTSLKSLSMLNQSIILNIPWEVQHLGIVNL
mgnify:CR=1 FL=1